MGSVTQNTHKHHIGSLILIITASLFVVIPVLWMISTSLKTTEGTLSIPPRLIPERFSVESYTRIWTDYPMGRYFANSLIAVSLSTVITLIFSSLAAYGLARFRLRGSGTILTFLLVTQMFPSVLLLIPFFQIIKSLGLINTHLGLIIVYIGFRIPLCSWMILGYFRTIPEDLDAAASIDGLNKFQVFYKITLPLSVPGIAATGIYAFFESWNEYMFAMVLTTKETMKTVPVGIGQLIGQYRIQWNDLMSASIVGSIPLLLVFLFLQRHLIGGLTSGAVKQ